MLTCLNRGQLPQISRLLAHAPQRYSAFDGVARPAARVDARAFTTTLRLMAEPETETETNTEKKTFRTRKKAEPKLRVETPKKTRTRTKASPVPKDEAESKAEPEAEAKTVRKTRTRKKAAQDEAESEAEAKTVKKTRTRKKTAAQEGTAQEEAESGLKAKTVRKPRTRKKTTTEETAQDGVEAGPKADGGEATAAPKSASKSKPAATVEPTAKKAKRREPLVRESLVAETEIAQRLAAAGIWTNSTSRGYEMNVSLTRSDNLRVNVVSDKLCDDIIKTLRPSLERHKGCDILDIGPGIGLWSRALHDAVQPRQHIMLEPRAAEYEPFLQDTMRGCKNVKIIPKLGHMWTELEQVLETYFAPHHTVTPPGSVPECNDSILITMNVTSFPKKQIFNFSDLSTLVTYQLIQNIRMSGLFQRYGLVRVLLWANDEVKYRLLPRNIAERSRPAFEAELACEHIHEVAGMDLYDFDSSRRNTRDEWLSYESARRCLRSMEELGIERIPGRETRMLKALEADPSLMSEEKLAGRRPIKILRPVQDELDKLRALQADGSLTAPLKARLHLLEVRSAADQEDLRIVFEFLQAMEALVAMGPSHPDFARLEREFNDGLDNVKKNLREIFSSVRDNYFTFHHSSGRPTLLWDRRAYEPLAVAPAEVYPNAPVCLLDLQPRPGNPLFRDLGPTTSRSGDFSDLLLRHAYKAPAMPLAHAVRSMSPGFGSSVDACATLTDPRAGGSSVSGHGALTVRSMSEANWADIVRAWMDWPFHPSYLDLIGRSPASGPTGASNEASADDDGVSGSAMGSANF